MGSFSIYSDLEAIKQMSKGAVSIRSIFIENLVLNEMKRSRFPESFLVFQAYEEELVAALPLASWGFPRVLSF